MRLAAAAAAAAAAAGGGGGVVVVVVAESFINVNLILVFFYQATRARPAREQSARADF